MLCNRWVYENSWPSTYRYPCLIYLSLVNYCKSVKNAGRLKRVRTQTMRKIWRKHRTDLLLVLMVMVLHYSFRPFTSRNALCQIFVSAFPSYPTHTLQLSFCITVLCVRCIMIYDGLTSWWLTSSLMSRSLRSRSRRGGGLFQNIGCLMVPKICRISY